jgi:nicotinate phosphoribosyltransferase
MASAAEGAVAGLPGRARSLGLFTDFYELTMLRAYRALKLDRTAVFSLFVRRLPKGRNFLVACGIEDFLDEIEAFRFAAEDIAYLRQQGFPDDFLDWLKRFRFCGEIHALSEGTPCFANEPLIEVVAPIGEAQLIETLALNQIGFQTLIASKAARVVEAAAGRPVIDFGSRRAQGLDAAIKAARASFVGGAEATSNVLAGRLYDIPVSGTMAHSFVQAFDDEMQAFRAFSSVYPDTVLLVDTYDTLEGVKKVIALANERGSAFKVHAVRLDSGDLLALSRATRAMLDAAGLHAVSIFASGGLDEAKLAALVAGGAPIDAFGVGTDLVVSGDAPSLDLVYKLTEYGGEGRIKLSKGKRTLPGRKQVFRMLDGDVFCGDTIAEAGETLAGTPLLQPVMRDGKRLRPTPPLAETRARCRAAISALPAELRAPKKAARPYPVGVSPALKAAERAVRARLARTRSKG